MARYYGMPAEGTGGGSECYVPGIQAGYERAINALLPLLSWPDILVGPGLLGGSMILSLEQLLIDVEIFRMGKRAHLGVSSGANRWLDDVIDQVGPAGHFLAEESTVDALRGGEWYISDFGVHESFEDWEAAGRRTLLEEARERVDRILATHEPLPLDDAVERELERIVERAKAEY
jgi:trimethylamine--corrinoid protein Co-methyltransferase